MKFSDLTRKEKIEAIQKLHERTGQIEVVIEKDWWATAVLRALFALPYSASLSFKGLCIATHKPFYV